MKKKLFSLVTAAVMAVTMTSMGAMPVFAVDKSENSNFTTAASTLKISKGDNEEYKDGEALVLFDAYKLMDKKSAKKMMGRAGDDFVVDKVWNFDNAEDVIDEEPAAGKSMMTFGGSSSAKGNFLNVALVKSDTLSTKKLIAKLSKMDAVLMAEPNYRIYAQDNSYTGRQWHLKNTGQDDGIDDVDLHISGNKWDGGSKGSKDVVVAVVDTGVDYKHPDLKDNIWKNNKQPKLEGSHGFDFANGDADPMDDNGHGTHCAGIIGANGAVSGVNKNVSIMGLKILDEEGSGWADNEVDAYQYINRALDLGVNIKAINNSWGGGEGAIFTKLAELVGSKGAVTLLAAGNAGMDEDENGVDYPQDPGNSYMLSVAASNNKGTLADFSNYGKKTVDLAAPGAGILSTVCYDNYLPSIYTDEQREALSDRYDGFEGSSIGDSMVPDMTDSGNYIAPKSGTIEITPACDESKAGAKDGHSLKLDFGNMKKGEFGAISIPYQLPEGYFNEKSELASYFSVMMNALADDGEGICAVADVPADEDLSTITDPMQFLFTHEVGGYYFDKSGTWNSFTMGLGLDGSESLDRKIVILCLAEESGQHTVYLDDMGISKADANEEEFGKYEFMSGTSMATPVVTGAIALAASELGADCTVDDLIAEVISHLNDSDEEVAKKTIEGGVLDYAVSNELGKSKPKLGKITIDSKTGNITIKGRGLEDTESVTLDNETIGPKEITDFTDKQKGSITFDASDYKYRVANVKLVTPRGEVEEKEVYIAGEENGYEDAEIEGVEGWDGAATDTKNVYVTNSGSGTLYKAPISKKSLEFEPIESLTFAKLFPEEAKKMKKDKNAKLAYRNGYIQLVSQPVVVDGKVYAIYGNSLGVEKMEDMGGWFFFSYPKAYADDDEDADDDDEDITSGENMVSYASDYGLVCMDPSLLNDDMLDDEDMEEDSDEEMTISKPIDTQTYLDYYKDVTLASYNGKIYFIGGYDFEADDTSTRVVIYDPSKKKDAWSEGPALPSGRAGGVALQTDSGLVYTMGYSVPDEEDENDDLIPAKCPKNLIFNGKEWKESTADIDPFIAGEVLDRNDKKYTAYGANVAITKGGLVYSGTPCDGLGDTF